MSGFLYFLEGQKAATAEAIARSGMGHALTAGRAVTRETTRGPGGAAGVIVAETGTPADAVAYRPDRQTWTQIESPGDPGDPGAWIGYDTDDPPGPGDLIRTDAIVDGYACVMETIAGDGEWVIPRARIYAEDLLDNTVPESDLPQALKMVGGRLVRSTLPRYRQACQDGERIWSAVMAANDEGLETVGLTQLEEFEISARILGVNYRLGVPEINALSILTTGNMARIIKCFVDWPAWAAHQVMAADAKKNAADVETPDTGSSNSGPPDDSTDTGQPAPTSNG